MLIVEIVLRRLATRGRERRASQEITNRLRSAGGVGLAEVSLWCPDDDILGAPRCCQSAAIRNPRTGWELQHPLSVKMDMTGSAIVVGDNESEAARQCTSCHRAALADDILRILRSTFVSLRRPTGLNPLPMGVDAQTVSKNALPRVDHAATIKSAD